MKVLLLVILSQVLSQSCLNHDGKEVGWWLMLNVQGGNGLTYLYCDQNSCDAFDYQPALEIFGPKSPLFLTVKDLDFSSSSSSDTLNIAWTDQKVVYEDSATTAAPVTTAPPLTAAESSETRKRRKATPKPKERHGDSKRLRTSDPDPSITLISMLTPTPTSKPKAKLANGAHAKGILSVSSKNKKGFIINHSLPRFPLIKDSKIEPELFGNAGSKAQHFFCVSLSIDDIEKIAELYSLAHIAILQVSGVNNEFKTNYEHISNLAGGGKVRGEKEIKDVQTLSLGSKNYRIKVFARSEKCHQDIYEYIAETLQIGLITETWGVGKAPLKTPYVHTKDGNKYKLVNNKKIKHKLPGVVIQYLNTVDHSKYAISDDSTKPYVCFSDLNWIKSDHSRGGTALCFKHDNLWKNIKESFEDIQEVK